MDIKNLAFVPDRVPMKFDTFCSIMKARYDTTDELYRELPHLFTLKNEYKEQMSQQQIEQYYSNLKQVQDFLDNIWDSVEPMTFKQASLIENIDLKREAFFYIGPAQMFNSIESKKLVDTFNFKPKDREPNVGDTYHLWKIDPKELGMNDPDNPDNRRRNDVFAVQCWCPSTGKEYWATVDDNEDFCQEGRYSAKEATAWFCMATHTKESIKEINRQGEVYMLHLKDNPKQCEPYHMDGDTYFKLLNQQT